MDCSIDSMEWAKLAFSVCNSAISCIVSLSYFLTSLTDWTAMSCFASSAWSSRLLTYPIQSIMLEQISITP